MLEAALSLTVFLALLISTFDFGQMLFFHQALVERVRLTTRWASLHAYDGTGAQATNMVLFGSPSHPGGGTPTFLKLDPDNVRVEYQAGNTSNPNSESITVRIVNFRYEFFSPWIAGRFVHANPISATAPMLYKP